MDALAQDTELAMFRPEFIAAVHAQAESDADAAADFVRLAIQAAGNTTVKLDMDRFDPAALIGFGLAVRLRRWEHNHIRAHIDAGLPSASKVLARMVKLGRGRKLARFVAWAMIASTKVFHDSFWWSTDDSDLHLDLAIVGREDDLFLDAITQFLLDHIRQDASRGSR